MTAMQTVHTTAMANGWTTRYPETGGVVYAHRDGTEIVIHYTNIGAVGRATLFNTDHDATVGGRDAGKRETVLVWLTERGIDPVAGAERAARAAAPRCLACGETAEVITPVAEGGCVEGLHYTPARVAEGDAIYAAEVARTEAELAAETEAEAFPFGYDPRPPYARAVEYRDLAYAATVPATAAAYALESARWATEAENRAEAIQADTAVGENARQVARNARAAARDADAAAIQAAEDHAAAVAMAEAPLESPTWALEGDTRETVGTSKGALVVPRYGLAVPARELRRDDVVLIPGGVRVVVRVERLTGTVETGNGTAEVPSVMVHYADGTRSRHHARSGRVIVRRVFPVAPMLEEIARQNAEAVASINEREARAATMPSHRARCLARVQDGLGGRIDRVVRAWTRAVAALDFDAEGTGAMHVSLQMTGGIGRTVLTVWNMHYAEALDIAERLGFSDDVIAEYGVSIAESIRQLYRDAWTEMERAEGIAWHYGPR